MKRLILFVVLILIIITVPIAWYLVSPLWTTIEVQEASPLDVPTVEESTVSFGDQLDKMTPDQKKDFEEQVEMMKGQIVVMKDAMPAQPELVAQGAFKSRAHAVEGQALLIEKDGKKILRFENFDTVNGPNLHIYLASSLGEGDFIDLGKIKATSGNINYEIPEGVDTERYNKVLVWCKPFRVLFSYAELIMDNI